MNLFQLATRGVDLSKLPDEEAPRQSVAFEPSTNGGKFSVPSDLNDAFEFAAKDFGIDPDVLRAVAYAESRFHPDVVSGKVKSKTGATGLMQFMPATAKEYGIDPLDPVQSIFGAAAYLRKSLDKFDGDYGKAVASYNAGPNRKDFDAEDWDARMPAETQGYLRTVFTAADQLKQGGAATAKPTQAATAVPDTGDDTARLAARYKAPRKERTYGEAAADTGAQLVEGVNNILGAVPNLIAPDSGVAQFFKGNADTAQGWQSDAIKQRTASAGAAIDKAGEDGVIAQVVEAAKQYSSDPALAARFVVTNLPSLIPGIGAAKLAQAAALARGATLAQAAATATTVAGGMNAALNAGSARGEAFDDLKTTLMKQGVPEAQATERALTGSLLPAAVGGVAGFISGKTGLEGAIVGKAGAKAAVTAGAKSLGAELGGEQLEEVVPKLATNYQASQIDNRSLGKDVGRTIVETAIGSGPGSVYSGVQAGLNARAAPTVESQPTTPTTPTVPPVAPTAPAADATQAVDNIASLIKQAEAKADGNTTQATPVQPGSQAVDAGAAPVAQGPADTGGGLAAAGTAAATGQSESAQSLTDVSLTNEGKTVSAQAEQQAAPAGIAAELAALKERNQQQAQPAQQQQAKPRAKPQPLLNDTEAAMLADFERMYQADVKGEIKTRLGLLPARQDEATAPAEKRKPSELLAAIKRAGGIKSTNAGNLMGGSAMDANRILPGLFKKDGMNLNLLVPFLKESGYLTQADEDSIKDNGGVNKLAEILQAELSGDRAQTVDSTAGYEADADKAMRSELDDKAFALGLPMKVTNEMSTERLNGVINRIERKLGKPVNTDFATRKMSRTEAMAERQAILMADRVERARAQYDADIQAFAEADDAVQDAVLDVFTDENGDAVIVNERDADAELAARTLNGSWSNQNGQETTTTQDSRTGADTREDRSLVARRSDQGTQADQGNGTEAGAGGQEWLTDDGIKIHPGKGLIKGKYLAEVDGVGLPGKPFDSETEAYDAALKYREVLAQRANEGAEAKRRKEAIADKLRNGATVTPAEIESLGLKASTSDMRWFMSRAADLFGLNSRQIRPLVKDMIKIRRSDMGTEYEYVPTRKALEAIAASQNDALTSYTSAEVTARQNAAKEAEATAKRAEDAASRAEAAAKQASEIAQRSVAAADTFELGGNAEDNLSGQEGLRFSKAAVKEVRNLVTLHNLSEENLLYAGKMGGIPVPSIGITKVDSPFGGFGSITLIAPKGMIDPENDVPVYDRYAWTARFPTLNFKKVKAKVADAFYERMKPAKQLGNDGDQFLSMLWEEMRNASVQNPGKITSLFTRYDAARLFYAKEVLGRTLKMPMRPVRPRVPVGHDKILAAYWAKNGDAFNRAEQSMSGAEFSKSPEMSAFKDAVRGAIERYADEADGDAALKAYLVKSGTEMLLPDDGMNMNIVDRLAQDFKTIGQSEIDGPKMRDAVRKLVPDNDPAYLKWVGQQVEPLFEAPTITVRGREVPVTLDNIVDAMTVGATAGAEKSMTFSPGKVAAMLGKQFKSIDEIKAARDQVVSAKVESEGKKTTDALLDEYREHVSQFYTHKDWRGNVDTWAANDDSMEALAKAGKLPASDANIKGMLSRMGFKGVDQRSVDLARQSIEALRNAATDYFEAKPQRAVKLNEFKGAVAPKDTSAEAIALLEQNGIAVEMYGKTEGAREKAIQKLAKRIDKERGDVLFSKSTAATNGITTEAAQKIVDGITAQWKNAPEVVVLADLQDVKAPKAVRDYDAQQRSQGAEGEPEGFWYKGKAYVVAGALNKPDDVARVLMHEALGHYGLRGVFGDDLKPILRQVAMMRQKDVAAKAEQYGLDVTDEAGRLHAAEEVLAEMAQSNPDAGVVKRAIAAIRAWMRKHIPGFRNMALTDSDIISNYLLPARNFVVNGGRDGGQDGGVRFQRSESAAQQNLALNDPSPAWMLPKSTKSDALVYELQDQKVDLKRTQDAIAEAGRTITEPFDARMAETLMPGRVAYRTETFLKTEVAPLMEAMAKNNVTQNELSDYLLARHAPERNAQIAKVNPEMPDGGAGTNSQGVLMTTQAAQDHIAALTTGKRMVLQLLANKIDAITASTRDLLVREGLEKQSTMDAWTGAYKHYVPLFKDEAVESPAHPIGSGMSVTGSASKRAMGSEGEVTNMVAHILMQREAAITRAEKNRVAMSLYGLALSNPNQEVWTTIRPNMRADKIGAELAAMGVDPVEAEQGMQGVPTIRTINSVTGLVQETPNPMYKRLENALVVKVDGEDRVILFNAKNADAMRMARALKNQDGLTNFDLAGSMVGTATRYFASINTQYNPAFGMVNVVRDIGGALVNLTTTGIADKKAKVLGDIPAAMKGIARDVRGDQARTPWSDLWVQFQEDGGRTGYRDLFIDPFKRAEAVQKDLDAMQRDGTASAGRVAHSILDLLDDFNTTLENGVRLSAYKAALDKGMSRPAAAKMARELTVDFNRKGRTGREVGPLYAFFNASVQGTARTIESLKGPAGKKIIAGGLMLGVIQSLMLAAAGFDDDEPPEFVKARAFIIPMGDKRYIAIPLQFGLNALPNTGRVITDLMLTGGKDAGKKTFNAIGEIMGSFNPLGGGNIFTAHGLLTTVAPTVADPLVDLATNTNFAGTPIGKDRADWDTRPGAKLARESTQRSLTGQAYIGISKAINAASGGNEFKKGLASPTPEQVQYVFTTAGGGLYRELEKTLNIAGLKADGMEVKSRMIPLGGRFAGEADDQDTQRSRYYRNSERLAALEAELKGFEKDDNEAAVRRIETERSDEVDLLGDYKHIRQAITKLNKLAADNINDMEMLKELDAERLELMRELNDSVRKLEKRSELFKRD